MVASDEIPAKYNKISDDSDEDSTHDLIKNGQNGNSTHDETNGQKRNSTHEQKNGQKRNSAHEQNGGGKKGDAVSIAVDGDSDADKFVEIVDKVINKFEVFRTRQGRAGLVHNFLRGLEIAEGMGD